MGESANRLKDSLPTLNHEKCQIPSTKGVLNMKTYITKYNRDNVVDNFFSDAFDGFFRPLFYDEKFDSMKTDIKENENDYTLEVELPGFDKKNISLDYENEYVTIRAEKDEKEEGKHNYIRKERSVSCQRSYYVGDIDEALIKANYANGILSVSIPKEERKKPAKHGINID